MSTTTRHVLLSCLILLVAACLCVGVVALGGAGAALLQVSRSATLPPTRVLITPLAPTATLRPGVTPTLTSTPVPGAEISPDEARQMDQIQQQVVQIRGLQPSGPVQRVLLTPDQLRQHVLTSFLKDYTSQDAQKDAILLADFGLLPVHFDLISFYRALYSEQIAGFYDDETKVMYVVEGQGFQGPERMTYAHEYTHVLQDQTFDLRNGLKYSDAQCQEDTERCAGIQALIEGDASLVEQDWLLSDSTPLDKLQVQQYSQSLQSPVYNSAPPFMQADFLFPYQSGLEFVQSLYDRGGWNAVDAAFQNPPVSSEQILHPQKYPDDKPVAVSLPDLSAALGSSWKELDSGVMGEWYTQLILTQGYDAKMRLPQSVGQKAAAGWGGDAYAVYYDAQTQASVTVLSTTWDTSQDAQEFASAFQQYGAQRWGSSTQQGDVSTWESSGAYTVFQSQGNTSLWLTAPDQATAQAAWQLLDQP